MKTVAIIGCPRSGTSWLSKVLRDWGLDIGHEKMNRDGGVGFNLINDHFGPTRKYQTLEDFYPDVILHVIRDPRHCIPSLIHHVRHTWKEYGDAEFFWSWHNGRCAEIADDWFQIEDTPQVLKSIARLIRVDNPNVNRKKQEQQGHAPWLWDRLRPETRELAESYGYSK